jgi:di/tricarboxylate transporter
MSQLQFDEEQRTPFRGTSTSRSGFARALIAWGIVKTERQATAILVLLVLICFGIILVNILTIQDTPPPPPLISTTV